MDLSPSRKKALSRITKGLLDAADIEIDAIEMHPVLKDLAHNVVKSVDETASNALLDKKVLRKMGSNVDAQMVKRPKEIEDKESVATTDEPQTVVVSDEAPEDKGGF